MYIYKAGSYDKQAAPGWHARAGGSYTYKFSDIVEDGWYASLQTAIDAYENPGKASVAEAVIAPLPSHAEAVAGVVAPLAVPVAPVAKPKIAKAVHDVTLPWAKG